MSGAGRKVFQPGEVLTASNVQNYLMDQAVQYYAGTAARGSAIGTATTEGMMSYLADSNSVQMATGTATWVNVDGIPIVAGTAARADLYPSPVPGNIVFRSDSLQRETYYAAAGTPTRSAGWYSGQDGGLVPIIPTSVTVGAGSATVTGNGLVTLSSAVTNFALNGVFSSAYSNYKIVMRLVGSSSNAGVYLRYRTGSTNTSASAYYYAGYYQYIGAGVAAWSSSAQQQVDTGRISPTYGSYLQYEISNPFTTDRTLAFGTGYSEGAAALCNNWSCTHAENISYDGFYIFPSSGTIYGTVQVYGYRN